MGPTLTGFISFLAGVGITSSVLPTDSPVIAAAFNVAMAIVNPAINTVGSLASLAVNGVDPNGQPTLYAYAVYNLATDRVINFAQDVSGTPNVPGSNPPAPFFQNQRQAYNINGFVSGVISGSSDEGTSQTLVVPDAMQLFTMRDLQTLKTPWGRAYMAIIQDFGYPFGMV